MKGRGRAYWAADTVMTAAAAQHRNDSALTEADKESAVTLTVFVSSYNEERYIATTLDTICAAAKEAGITIEIIVIDDGSKDRSLDVLKDYVERHPDENIVVRVNRVNKGLAQNYIDGAFIGRGKYYRLICGDNAEPKESIVEVMKAIGRADIIVPYYVSTEGKSAKRQFISKTYTWLVNHASGYNLHYYNGLAVHLRQNVMRWHTNTRGFGFQAEILCHLLDLGFSYAELPIVTIEQREGKSNALTLRNLLSVTHTLVEIASRRISNVVYRK